MTMASIVDERADESCFVVWSWWGLWWAPRDQFGSTDPWPAGEPETITDLLFRAKIGGVGQNRGGLPSPSQPK